MIISILILLITVVFPDIERIGAGTDFCTSTHYCYVVSMCDSTNRVFPYATSCESVRVKGDFGFFSPVITSCSRMMIRVLVNSFALGLAQTDLRFPLSIDSHGNFLMNVSVPSIGIGSISALVNMGSINTMMYDGSMAMGGRMEIHSLINDAMYSWEDDSMLISNEIGDSVLTIGPESELTRSVGSVAIVRRTNGTELVIRSTLDRFIETCTPGTLLRAQFAANNRVNGTFSTSAEPPRLLHRVEWHTVEDRHLVVPVNVIEEISELMIRYGAIQMNDNFEFDNCSAEMIAALPNINIFIQTINGGQMSRLVLFPEDYLKTRGISCQLRLMRQSGAASKFNPLQIPNINIRVSSDNVMEFCDSQE